MEVRDRVLVGIALALAATWVVRFRAPAAVDPGFRSTLDHTLDLLGPEPHPVGTEAHERARAALFAELAALGAAPVEHRAMVCGDWGRCAAVVNLIGRLGPADGAPVAVVAHYDSVGAGAGAADDGSGVAAVLDIARRYHDTPPPRPVLFVLTDGEELGLLGARALVQDHVLDGVAAVVNLEARGTDGPSLLFETAGPSGPAAARFASVASRPFSSSLFDAIYQVLPNDTDLSELRDIGMPAFNLAFIGSPLDYHTPADGEVGLSVTSAAHQAAEATRLVDSLVHDPPADGAAAVWFDVFGFGVVRFPQVAVVPLSLLALFGLGFGAWNARVRPRSVALGVVLPLLGTVAAVAVGAALVVALHWTTDNLWRERAWAVQLALVASGAAIGLAVPRLGPDDDRGGVWFGAAAVWTALALVVAVMLPGASFLWVVPAVVGAALSARPAIAAAVAALAAIVVWSPVVGLLYAALGSPLAATVTVAATMATGGLGLALRRGVTGRRAAVGCAALAVVGTVAGLLPTSEQDDTNLVVEYDGGRTSVALESGTAAPPNVAGPSPEAPLVDVSAGGLHVRSARGATTLGVRWEGPPAQVTVDGVPAFPVERGDRWELWVYGVGEAGVELHFDPRPAQLQVLDELPGLPAGTARPADTYPYQWGDRTRVSRPVVWGP